MASHPPSVAPRGMQTRGSSGNAAVKPDVKPSRRQTAPAEPEVHFTALIRLPFPRGGFVDPPPVEWDASKDRALWKVISRSPKTSDLDWEELATRFEVSPAFILQQAAWLYERHLSHVRAQMRKVGSSNAPTPVPNSGSVNTTAGGLPMKRLGSGGGSRAPSALSIRSRDSPAPKDASVPGTPRAAAPSLSRTPSTTTVTQSRHFLPPSPRQPLQRSFRTSMGPPPPRRLDTPPTAPPEPAQPTSPRSPSSPAMSSSSSSSSSSDTNTQPLRRSQIFKRPPRFTTQKSPLGRLDDENEDGDDADEDSPTFLPFATQAGRTSAAQGERQSQSGHDDPSATLRSPDDRPPSARPTRASSNAAGKQPLAATPSAAPAPPAAPSAAESSTSSASSGAAALGTAQGDGAARDAGRSRGRSGLGQGPLSPRHRAELARLSPRQRGKAREGSDGTPSMGSSFSDLDDASVTQSALEEALLSNMQHGAMSRMSNLSQAFRSRYL